MQNPVTCIAVDDSLLDHLMLREYASVFSFLKELGMYSHPNEGLTAIKELKPDLAFLDIEMRARTGIELLRAVWQLVPSAVFITSHPVFALEGS